MNKPIYQTIITFIAMALTTSCGIVAVSSNTTASKPETKSWEQQLSENLPYLGHRNWIVVADMAYPLQSGAGIITLYADEPYTEVVARVKKMIDSAPHVFAHIYNDTELGFIREEDAPGVEKLRKEMKAICGDEAQSMMHEDLLSRMDAAGKLYTVTVIKTPLTIPYSTTFFELDCAYWGAAKQAVLDRDMAESK